MLDRLEASMSFYKQALDLRTQRQDVLAANIANADTPGYKARDFDFKAELGRAMDQGGTRGSDGLAMQTTARAHIPGRAPGSVAGMELDYRAPTQPSLDGNTVDMDVERVQFMDNAVHHRADLQILGSQIKGLRAAMQPER